MNSAWRTFGIVCAAALVLTSCASPNVSTPPTDAANTPSTSPPTPNLTTAEPLSTAASPATVATTLETAAATTASDTAAPNLASTWPQTGVDKLKFKRANGSEAFSIKFKPDGGKLVNANDQELARFKAEANQTLRIKGANDQLLGYVRPEGNAWAIAGANQQVFFVLRPRANGNYQLEDGNGAVLQRIKAREDGYKIASSYKVKIKPGKLSLRDGAGETLLSTKDAMQPLAIAAFALDPLSQEQQGALALALDVWGN